jgi:hypothetical protein
LPIAIIFIIFINKYKYININTTMAQLIEKFAQGGSSKESKLCSAGADHVKDRDTLIDLLKDAFCEEMNAWYQYLIVAPFLKGNERTEIAESFE